MWWCLTRSKRDKTRPSSYPFYAWQKFAFPQHKLSVVPNIFVYSSLSTSASFNWKVVEVPLTNHRTKWCLMCYDNTRSHMRTIRLMCTCEGEHIRVFPQSILRIWCNQNASTSFTNSWGSSLQLYTHDQHGHRRSVKVALPTNAKTEQGSCIKSMMVVPKLTVKKPRSTGI